MRPEQFTASAERNVRNKRKNGIRHVSLFGVEMEFEGRARGRTEFASSRTAALVDAHDWKLLSGVVNS